MDRAKIGKFITEKRLEQNLTVDQLADKLDIKKEYLVKWENGSRLPDAVIVKELCECLGITVNELISGESIPEEQYKEVADSNLHDALLSGNFNLEEKIAYYTKKWHKDHISTYIMCAIAWLTLVLALKLRNVEIYYIGAICALFAILFVYTLRTQMTNYIEERAFGKRKK
ncbi:MAG: helix-turn-helix transcriptional regulator [Erysipelotrichaceae bacterium]|nr:helix-turn-helix transcriptional regulator [Erysipelotrichaceae bacterium]